MQKLLILAIIILCIIILIKFIKLRFINTKFMQNMFKDHVSIAVVGPRRMGKDTLMSYIAYGKPHNCNVMLQPNTNVIPLNKIMIPNLTRQNLIYGKHLNIDRTQFEFLDNMTFISDTSLYFPNYEDKQLKQEYPFFANQLAIWGHLFDGPLHFNIQRESKLWLQIREHIYTVIECRGCIWLPLHTIIKTRYYERVEDYEAGKVPMIKKGLGANKKGEVIAESGNRGEILDKWVLVPRRYIKHNTHIFREIVFKNNEERRQPNGLQEKRKKHKLFKKRTID